MKVLLAREGQADFDRLPLRKEWAGHYRIRTGDWRVIFQVLEPDVIVVRIKHRSEVYED